MDNTQYLSTIPGVKCYSFTYQIVNRDMQVAFYTGCGHFHYDESYLLRQAYVCSPQKGTHEMGNEHLKYLA